MYHIYIYLLCTVSSVQLKPAMAESWLQYVLALFLQLSCSWRIFLAMAPANGWHQYGAGSLLSIETNSSSVYMQ